MKNTTKKLLLDTAFYVLGGLITLFMCLCIFAHQDWALYVEISLLPPFWCVVIVEIIIWFNKKKDEK